VVAGHGDVLITFGSAIRAARRRRAWSQARLASEAGVSLAQLALMEKGRNVSVLFLTKVADVLGLSLALVSGAASDGDGSGRMNISDLVRRTDLIALLAAELRDYAINAALPAEQREALPDTEVVSAFVGRVLDDDAGMQRLVEAMHRMSAEGRAPRRVDVRTAPVSKRARKTAG
jgi:transcriptional regulator with XRE-family HTH domain